MLLRTEVACSTSLDSQMPEQSSIIIFKNTTIGPWMHVRYVVPMYDYLYQYLDPKILTERRWCIQLPTFKKHAWSKFTRFTIVVTPECSGCTNPKQYCSRHSVLASRLVAGEQAQRAISVILSAISVQSSIQPHLLLHIPI